MPAAVWKIRIDQGETWRLTLRLKDDQGPIVLDGYIARMQIRESVDSPVPLHSLTSDPGGGITIDGPAGALALRIPDEVTAAWQWRWGVYGLEIEDPDGDTTPLLKGEVEVSREVTR